MSMPPVSWIIEQQRLGQQRLGQQRLEEQRLGEQRLAAERKRLDKSLLLLLSGVEQVDSGTLKERRKDQAVYATLAIGRVRFDAVEVTIGGEIKLLKKPEATIYFKEQIVDPIIRENEMAKGNVARGRDEFIASAVVSESVEVVKPAGRIRKESLLVDVVEFEGQRFERAPGSGRHFVKAEAERRFPNPASSGHPVFISWWEDKKKDVRTWKAELFTAEGGMPVEFTDGNWSWGYPIEAALKVLDQLSSEGWDLVHVSEDRGLYAGEDSSDESYPARARYLLAKRASGLP